MFCAKCGLEKEDKKRCKNCAKLYHLQYSKINKEKLAERSKVWYQNNKEQAKQYKEDNKVKIRARDNNYQKFRRINDLSFKLRKNCSRLINHALNGNKNGKSMLEYLPYTMQELKTHLELQFDENMSWNNYGIYWHVDHIYPQSLLPYASMNDDNFKKCWALENLQPLEKIENLKKSNKVMVK